MEMKKPRYNYFLIIFIALIAVIIILFSIKNTEIDSMTGSTVIENTFVPLNIGIYAITVIVIGALFITNKKNKTHQKED